MSLRVRFCVIALAWVALILELLHPGQFRFYLVHDGGPFQLDFSGSANDGSIFPAEADSR
jgi:hypothetical protein